MKILIAYDGLTESEAILSQLKRMGLTSPTEILLVSVVELWLFSNSVDAEYVEICQLSLAQMEKVATEAKEKLQKQFPECKVNYKIELGSPAQQILGIAEDWKPDLILIGSRSRSEVNRFLFGSVSQKVVTEAHCSVRVTRSQEKANEHIKLVIGLDGSPSSNAALDALAKHRWDAGTEVKLISAIGLANTMGLATSNKKLADAFQDLFGKAEELHKQATDKLTPLGLKVSSLIKEGDPKQILIKEAEDWKADTIFLGSRGLTRFKRLWLGSVSTAVVSRAHCSVEVVR